MVEKGEIGKRKWADTENVFCVALLAVAMTLTLLPTDVAFSGVHLWWLRGVCVVCALSCGWRLIVGGRFKMTVTDWLVTACYVYGALNVYIVGDTPCATKFAVASLCFASYLSVRLLLGGGGNITRIHLAVLPLLCLLAGLYEAGLSLMQLGGHAHSRHFFYAFTGTFCNPGPLGGFLAVLFAVGLAAWACERKKRKCGEELGMRTEKGKEIPEEKDLDNKQWGSEQADKGNEFPKEKVYYNKECGRGKAYVRWLLALTLLMLPLMVATGNRAALLSVGVSTCLLCRNYLRKHWKWALAVAVVVVVAGYCGRRGSADTRFFMAVAACEHLRDRAADTPSLWWTGVGVGGYLHHVAEGMAAYFGAHPASAFIGTVGVPDHSFCEPVRILVERGIVGLVLFLAAWASGLAALWKRRSPLLYGLVALAVFSCFSYPFSSPAFCLLFAVFLAVGSALQAEKPEKSVENSGLGQAEAAAGGREEPCKRPYAHRRLRLISPAVAVCAVCVLPLATFPPRVRANMDYARFAGMEDAAFIMDCYELWPDLCENPRFLFNFASLLRRQGRYNDSNAMLREGVKISADPMFHILMGRNYEDMSLFPQADSAYAHAFLMQPNRVYPLYRRMKLSLQAGDTARAERTAHAVAGLLPKVENSATDAMQAEAAALLRERGGRRP